MMVNFQGLCQDRLKGYWSLAMDKRERDGVKFLIALRLYTGTLNQAEK